MDETAQPAVGTLSEDSITQVRGKQRAEKRSVVRYFEVEQLMNDDLPSEGLWLREQIGSEGHPAP